METLIHGIYGGTIGWLSPYRMDQPGFWLFTMPYIILTLKLLKWLTA